MEISPRQEKTKNDSDECILQNKLSRDQSDIIYTSLKYFYEFLKIKESPPWDFAEDIWLDRIQEYPHLIFFILMSWLELQVKKMMKFSKVSNALCIKTTW